MFWGVTALPKALEAVFGDQANSPGGINPGEKRQDRKKSAGGAQRAPSPAPLNGRSGKGSPVLTVFVGVGFRAVGDFRREGLGRRVRGGSPIEAALAPLGYWR